jgi:D-glycero-D-manno-heptose 1,7-bisphosphate phosphatase
MDGAREAVKLVNEAGYFAFIVTNQSGVARGFYEESHGRALHHWMADELAAIGAHVDANIVPIIRTRLSSPIDA